MCEARSVAAGGGGPRQNVGGIPERRGGVERSRELLHPGTSEAKAHGMLKDAHSELLGSVTGCHPLDTLDEASARFRTWRRNYGETVRRGASYIVKNLVRLRGPDLLITLAAEP